MTTSLFQRYLTIWSATCVLTLASLATARATGADEKLDDALRHLDEQSRRIEDLTADFVEQKFTAMLKEPLVSKGHVKVVGTCTRWDTTEPNATTMFTDDRQVVLYFPSRKTAEVYPIDRRLRPLIVSPIPRLATLRSHFRIEESAATTTKREEVPGTLQLTLTPKDEALAEFLDQVRVAIDPAVGLARRVEMIDPDGDRTVIAFTDIRTNVGLKLKDVACDFPADTRIVHPLESAEDEAAAAPGSDHP